MKQNYFSLLFFTIALMVGGGLFAQTPCGPDGDGNPETNPNGEGEGTENVAGDLAWELLLNTTCQGQSNNNSLGLKDYDPSDQCNNSSNLIPESGQQYIKIAIIDSGVLPTEPGYFNGQRLTSHIVSAEGVVSYGVAYPHPHGTYSAGVISGMLTQFVGGGNNYIVPKFEFLDYQVLDGELRTSLAAVVAAIDHAVASKANLIALSIGFLPRDCDNIDWEDTNNSLYLAIENARQNGVVVITSAGNDGNDLGQTPQYPAAYSQLDNLVSVGALSCEAEVPASFSNYGPEVVDVFTTGAYVQVFYNGCFHTINGTSFATSIVAGKAAIHFTKYSSADKVLCLLRSQTKSFQSGKYSIYGIVDVPARGKEGVCDLSGSGGSSNNETKKLPITQTLNVEISPNPFRDQLRVKLENLNGPANISLLNGLGQQVIAQRVVQRDQVLDLDHLTTGVYWLIVRDANGSQSRAVIKK